MIRQSASYELRKLFYDVLVADEAHELSGAETAQGNALGTIAAVAKKTMLLTGTLCNGTAASIRRC